MDDNEQLEQLTQWWHEHKTKVLTFLVVAFVAYFGSKYWVNKQNTVAQNASTHYEEFVLSLENNDNEAAVAQGQNILNQFQGSPYASLAALHLAKHYSDNNDFNLAIEQLKWVLEHSDDTIVSNVAKTRLSALYIGQQKADEVIALWKNGDEIAYYAPIYNELLGDAYLLKNDRKKAYQHYKKAFDLLKENKLNHFVLSMKLDNLAEYKED